MRAYELAYYSMFERDIPKSHFNSMPSQAQVRVKVGLQPRNVTFQIPALLPLPTQACLQLRLKIDSSHSISEFQVGTYFTRRVLMT